MSLSGAISKGKPKTKTATPTKLAADGFKFINFVPPKKVHDVEMAPVGTIPSAADASPFLENPLLDEMNSIVCENVDVVPVTTASPTSVASTLSTPASAAPSPAGLAVATVAVPSPAVVMDRTVANIRTIMEIPGVRLHGFVWFLFRDMIGVFIRPESHAAFRIRFDGTRDNARMQFYESFTLFEVMMADKLKRDGTNPAAVVESTIAVLKNEYDAQYGGLINDTNVHIFNSLKGLTTYPSDTSYAIQSYFGSEYTNSTRKVFSTLCPAIYFVSFNRWRYTHGSQPAGCSFMIFALYLHYCNEYENREATVAEYFKKAVAQNGIVFAPIDPTSSVALGSVVVNAALDGELSPPTYFSTISKPDASGVPATVCHPTANDISVGLHISGSDTSSPFKFVGGKKLDWSGAAVGPKIRLGGDISVSCGMSPFSQFCMGIPLKLSAIMNATSVKKSKKNGVNKSTNVWAAASKVPFSVQATPVKPTKGSYGLLGNQFISMFLRNPLVCFSYLVGFVRFDVNNCALDADKFICINGNVTIKNLLAWFAAIDSPAERFVMFYLFFLKYYNAIVSYSERMLSFFIDSHRLLLKKP